MHFSPGCAGRRSGILLPVAVLLVSACSEVSEPVAPFDDAAGSAVVASAVRLADEFDTFDESRWHRSNHPLGRGWVKPANVGIVNGRVVLTTKAAGYDGAEIRSLQTWGTGTFSARARCAAPTGTVCAFFLYQIGVGDSADEIDIEINSGTRQIWFTTWVAGKRVNHAAKTLSFDPKVAFNTYTIERGTTQIRFLVNGAVLHTYRHNGKGKLPQAAMPLFANSWWPTWMTPTEADGTWEIDWIEVR